MPNNLVNQKVDLRFDYQNMFSEFSLLNEWFAYSCPGQHEQCPCSLGQTGWSVVRVLLIDGGNRDDDRRTI